ncbi:hypothetical protein R1sor_009698 [Riccia sorocarpa]|uniref:Uncharacterized protein n=1 Tax=Riccia sorocarpa TaxID=122646 RepID=A0ABD3HZF8_9MARC
MSLRYSLHHRNGLAIRHNADVRHPRQLPETPPIVPDHHKLRKDLEEHLVANNPMDVSNSHQVVRIHRIILPASTHPRSALRGGQISGARAPIYGAGAPIYEAGAPESEHPSSDFRSSGSDNRSPAPEFGARAPIYGAGRPESELGLQFTELGSDYPERSWAPISGAVEQVGSDFRSRAPIIGAQLRNRSSGSANQSRAPISGAELGSDNQSSGIDDRSWAPDIGAGAPLSELGL